MIIAPIYMYKCMIRGEEEIIAAIQGISNLHIRKAFAKHDLDNVVEFAFLIRFEQLWVCLQIIKHYVDLSVG